MKITESKLRKMIREVLREFTTSATAAGAKKKGYKSPERIVKKKTYDTKKTAVDTKKSAYDTKKSAFDTKKATYDTKQSDYDTKKAAQDASKASTNYDTKKSALTSATNTYNTKAAELQSHIDDEPTKFGATQYSYTNTATNKKVTTTTDPGNVGGWTIGAAGGPPTLDKATTNFWYQSETPLEGGKGQTPSKTKKDLAKVIDKDRSAWDTFLDKNLGKVPVGAKEILDNINASRKALDGIKEGPEKGFEYNSPGNPEGVRFPQKDPIGGKGRELKGEAGKTTKKFGTSKEHKADTGANKSAFSAASVSETKPITSQWTSWNNTKTTKTNAKNSAETTKNNAQDAFDAAEQDFTTKQASANAAKTARDTALTAKQSAEQEKQSAEQEKQSAEQEKQDAEDEWEQAKEDDLKKEVPTEKPPAAGGGFGKGKTSGKGKGKGKKGKKGKEGEEDKNESLFRILGRDTLNEIKEIKKYNTYLKQPRNRRRK